jgi:hypothetical protein
MNYVCVTTICRDLTSVQPRIQHDQRVPREVGVSTVLAAVWRPSDGVSPLLVGPSDGTVVAPNRSSLWTVFWAAPGCDILPVGVVLGDPSLSGYPKDFRALSYLRSARTTVGDAVKLVTQ